MLVLPSNFTLELFGRVPSGVIWATEIFPYKVTALTMATPSRPCNQFGAVLKDIALSYRKGNLGCQPQS
ncbi:hypothetical protein A6769_07465 [Nostoc punctiforme NIES-2108]|uniref:Uncharacterized protein n=1 Tax=Nostoc punctiforme NIES-2108 TaxID=1356359 RepID=A0A367RS70_NOSPU|nr:hypothetical protein A6769_07465 [Nostoc punctiforme NIES-2108]